MSTALVTYPLEFPYINAYFTDRIIYSEDGRNISGKKTFSTMNKGVAELYFDIHTFTNLNVYFSVKFVDDILIAVMNLPDDCGFDASDIIISSLELSYNNEIIDLSPISVETKGKHIELKYNWSKIEGFIDSDDNSPAFDLSGKGQGLGKSGLGEKFIFKGSGRTPDLQKEFFEQMEYFYFIKGPTNIIIPTAEEGPQVYSYVFYIDDKEVPPDEVEWELSSEVSGVKLKSGELTVTSNAEGGNITITATLKSNKYFTTDLEIELVKIVEEEIEEIIEEIVEDQAEIPDESETEGEQLDKEQEDVNLPQDPTDKNEDTDEEEGKGDGEDSNDDSPDTENEGKKRAVMTI